MSALLTSRGVVSLVCALVLLPCMPVAEANVNEWNFRVLLNDKEIGFHHFRVSESAGVVHLDSNAEFDVRFLFFSAYSYSHRNRETWDESCLRTITTSTAANGVDTQVSGKRDGAGFVVSSGEKLLELDGCVMSFAYWNPAILQRSQLLNAQTGEYLDVDIEGAGKETLRVRGIDVTADRFRIRARNMQIDVWYSEDRNWLALESLTDSGRIIRYELN